MFKIILIISQRDCDLKILFILKRHIIIEGTMLLRPFLIPKRQYTVKGLYGFKNTLNSEGTEGVE